MSKVSLVKMSSYTSPDIIEDNSSEWVKYGEDDNYFQHLIDRKLGSPTNNAAITSICNLIYGKGLDATDGNKETEGYVKMKSLFSKDDQKKWVNDLKTLGQCAIQVIKSKDRKTIAKCTHIPIETIRAKKLKDGETEVQSYGYCADWENKTPSDVIKEIPAFGTSKEAVEILYVKPYSSGYYYYSPVDYQGALQYAELEEEISNYHLNNILNGLSPSMLINFNNGIPTEEEQKAIERKIQAKYGGSTNAGQFVLMFNDDKESQATIEPIELSDAHNQYTFLSEESSNKILVGHRITSPMLLGIKNNTGFGNNADELKNASILFDNMVIKGFQEMLLDAFDKILAFNGIELNLYFKTLQPLEFTDVSGIADKEAIEEETGVKMSFNAIEELGEDEDLDEWELIDERKVDYDTEEDLDAEIDRLNNPKKSVLSKVINFVKTGKAIPNANSSQDGESGDYKYKVRYQYAPLTASENSRDFCKKMVAAKKIYRKEDIMRMGDNIVNKGWGPEGADKYSIWLYKGGGDCRHFWMRKTYRSKGGKTDVRNPNAEVSVNKVKKDGFKPEVNDKKVAQRPRDMKNRGFLKPR